MCQAAQAHEDCGWCDATATHPCTDKRPGVHYSRICRAAHDGHITYGDATSVMYGEDGDAVFAGWDLVLDEVTA
jgi:hypothetical protein